MSAANEKDDRATTHLACEVKWIGLRGGHQVTKQ
jgi:hypothetical protein